MRCLMPMRAWKATRTKPNSPPPVNRRSPPHKGGAGLKNPQYPPFLLSRFFFARTKAPRCQMVGDKRASQRRFVIPVQGIMPWGSRKEMRVPTKQANPHERFYFWGHSPPHRLARCPHRRLTPRLADFYAGFLMARNVQKKTGQKDGLLRGESSVARRCGRPSECYAASSSIMFCGVLREASSRPEQTKVLRGLSTHRLGA
jgi:hypothetical protein